MEWVDEKEFLAVPSALEEILAWSNKHVATLLKDKKAKMRMRLAIEEAIVNVVRYAYAESKEEPVLKLKIGKYENGICYEMRDRGKPFNPIENITANPNLKLFERTVGGWGRAIMVSFTDDITYAYEDGWNKLAMYKKDQAQALVNRIGEKEK